MSYQTLYREYGWLAPKTIFVRILCSGERLESCAHGEVNEAGKKLLSFLFVNETHPLTTGGV